MSEIPSGPARSADASSPPQVSLSCRGECDSASPVSYVCCCFSVPAWKASSTAPGVAYSACSPISSSNP